MSFLTFIICYGALLLFFVVAALIQENGGISRDTKHRVKREVYDFTFRDEDDYWIKKRSRFKVQRKPWWSPFWLTTQEFDMADGISYEVALDAAQEAYERATRTGHSEIIIKDY